MKRLLLSTAAVALSIPAFAADLGAGPDYSYAPEPAAAAATWAAYFDIHGGYGFGEQDGEADVGPGFFDEDWEDGTVGGALRIAAFLSPAFSVQGDVWANYWDGDGDGTDNLGDYDFSFDILTIGAGGHLTYNAAPGSLVGVLASYGWENGSDGGDFDNEYVNVGVEAAHEFGPLRAYVQGGYTVAVNGDNEEIDVDSWYGAGKLTYYFNDNFAISGILAYDRTEADGGIEEDDFGWGARLEAKPWDLPVSVYASYLGDHWETEVPGGDIDGTEHTFLAGVTFMANSASIRERDQTVGLKDMNGLFGDLP